MTVTAEQIRMTAARIDAGVIRTPMLGAPMLSRHLGCDLFLKMECLQHTSSFKARGALNAMQSLSDEQRKNGVITMSAGNHAQAVAYYANRMGVPATIVMPAQTPFAKVARTRAFGANVVLEGRNLNECEGTVKHLIDDHALTLIHPYDDELVMMGQGTAGLACRVASTGTANGRSSRCTCRTLAARRCAMCRLTVMLTLNQILRQFGHRYICQFCQLIGLDLVTMTILHWKAREIIWHGPD